MFTFTTRALAALLVASFAIGLSASGAAPEVAQDTAAAIKRGQQVYGAQKCSTCHLIAGQGSKRNPLDGVGAKLNAADIRSWITDPVGMAAKTKSTKKPVMQAKYSKLPAADIDGLVAYMQSLK